MIYDVFISYRREGGYDTAKHLNDLLVRDGYKVSFDIDTLRSGDFDNQLYARIDQCKDFILIVDQYAFDRTLNPNFNPKHDWLRCELAYALKTKKNVIPIFLSGITNFPQGLPSDIVEVTKKNGPEFNRYYFNDFYKTLKERFLHKKNNWLKFIMIICAISMIVGISIALLGNKENDVTPFTNETYDSRAIDLGLSVKWASYNLGANTPEEFGNYFGYSHSYHEGGYSLTFPTINNICGSEEDYVRNAWGEQWRLPSSNELQELKNKCKWEWVTNNGVKGYIIIGPNGNSIFLPAAGVGDFDEMSATSGWNDIGTRGSYQSGTISVSDNRMWILSFWEGGIKISDNGCLNDAFRSVRPVMDY